MKLNTAHSDLSIQWQDVDATSTLYDVAIALGVDDAPTGAEVSSIARRYALSSIQSLDVSPISIGSSKTLVSLGESDGKISATAVKIQIDKAQVNCLVNDLASISSTLSAKQDILVATSKAWMSQKNFRPRKGQIVIWSDKDTVLSAYEENGHHTSVEIVIPGIKIGNGNAYNLDLPFVGDDTAMALASHIQSRMHVTDEERASWNHKITIGDIDNPDDTGVDDNETLIITRK